MVHQHQFDIVVTTRIALPLWMKRRMHRQNGARCTRPMLVGERKIEDSYCCWRWHYEDRLVATITMKVKALIASNIEYIETHTHTLKELKVEFQRTITS